MALWQVYLSGLVADPEPCVRRKGRLQSLYLAQSVLDGSCGLLAVLQAAMVLGGFSRAQVLALPTSRHPVLRRLWKQAQATYFHGATATQMIAYVDAFSPQLTARIIRPRRIGHIGRLVQAILDAGAVPIAGFTGRGFSHWALVIGMERNAQGRPLALLLLDPSVAEPLFGLFNARMELGAGAVQYATPDSLSAVRLCELVIVQHGI